VEVLCTVFLSAHEFGLCFQKGHLLYVWGKGHIKTVITHEG